MLTSSDLKYFFEVANTLNLSRASERLGISQPSLSLAIKRLENKIGTDVIIRHKRGVFLTQAGKQLLAHSKQLMQKWDEIKAKTLSSHHEVQGHFTIGCHPSVALNYLSGFLPPLLTMHPKLEIQLVHDISRKITERVINLSVDIGIVVNPIKHPDLIMHKLKEDQVTFWQAKQVKNDSVDFNSGNAIIICDLELTQTQWLLKQIHKKRIKYSRILPSSSLEVIANLTSSGCGVGILPGSVVACMALKKMIPLQKMPAYHDEIYLIYRSEHRSVKAIQTINQAIKKSFV